MIIHILCVVVLLILLRWQLQDIMLDKKLKKYSTYCILLTLLVVLAETGCTLTDNTVPENRGWSILFNVIGFGMSPFVFLVESQFYYLKKVEKEYWFYVPALLNLFCVIASPFTGWIFYVTEECKYSRGPLFPVYILAFLFSILLTMCRKIYAIRNYPRYFHSRIIGSTCIMLLGLVVQVVYPKYIVSWLLISVYLVLYYALSCETSGMIDGLTGLLNRMSFNKMLDYVDGRKKKEYFLVMIDANDFKQINDTQGHTYGDFCLKEIAAILMDVFGTNAHVFRYGGDEFCVLMTAGQKEDMEKYLTEVSERIAEKKQKQAFPTLAMGYERFETGKELQEIINRADTKMYQNKQEMKAKGNKLEEKPNC